MRKYFRIMAGKRSIAFKDALTDGVIGCAWLGNINLVGELTNTYKEFNEKFIPVYTKEKPNISKISAGLACGMLWTICKEIQIDDIILMPDSSGNYYIGTIIGNYEYNKNFYFPHFRKVIWNREAISRDVFSESLRYSMGSIGTVSNISKYATEIEKVINGNINKIVIPNNDDIESPVEFVIEEHLRDFLIKNWDKTIFGKKYDIYTDENGEQVGRQFPCANTGWFMDILAVSKDKKELVVIELKKGNKSDKVIGQIARYMGYAKEELADKNQIVKGILVLCDGEKDEGIIKSLSVLPNVEYYTYKIDFHLDKQNVKLL